MIAERSKYMSEAVQAMYELNADEIMRQRCLAREDYYRMQRTYEHALERALAEKDEALQKQSIAQQELNNVIKLLHQQQEENARLQALLNPQQY